ncbi:MAG: hypothetical protein PVS3B2_02530 [Candidatus Dormibacteraceae bacterium]
MAFPAGVEDRLVRLGNHRAEPVHSAEVVNTVHRSIMSGGRREVNPQVLTGEGFIEGLPTPLRADAVKSDS